MIELIFVIVIIGILAVAAKMAMPDTRLYSDTDFVLQQLQQTRMHALLVDHEALGEERWRTEDYNDTCIRLDKNSFNNLAENSKDPKKYRLSLLTAISASVPKVCFDRLGRPYREDYRLNNFLKMPIELNITYKEKRKLLLIMPYSGGVIVKH